MTGKGGAVLQKPQLQTATRVGPPKNKEKTEQKFETKEEESEKFAVVLVGDKDYDQGHVVKIGREGGREGRGGRVV